MTPFFAFISPPTMILLGIISLAALGIFWFFVLGRLTEFVASFFADKKREDRERWPLRDDDLDISRRKKPPRPDGGEFTE